MEKAVLFVYLLVGGVLPAFSQNRYVAGTIPQLNITVSVAKNYKLNTKLESRLLVSERTVTEVTIDKFRYERTDLTLVLTRKLSVDNTIGGGYLIRLENRQLTHRLIQQFNHVHTLDLITLAHRIVADETFRNATPAEFRIRYRISLEKALSGRRLDPRELYVKGSSECLGLWANRMTDLELRSSLAVGYNTADENKLELGVDYRVTGFGQSRKAHQFWATVGYFLSL